MTLYSYTAVDEHNRPSRGRHEASDIAALESHLQRTGLYLIRARRGIRLPSARRKSIARAELITLFFNLEQLLHAGVPLLDSLSDLCDSMDNPALREIIAGMLEAIKGGKTLSQSMMQYPQAFDSISISLIYAGEESGCLPEMFARITESLKWRDELITQTRNLMLYPAFVGIVVLGIFSFLMIYVAPQLLAFVRSMGQTLPLHTRLLMATSSLFTAYWYLIAGLPVALYMLFRLAAKHDPELLYRLDALKLRLWLIGPILSKIILARFAHTFAMMYGAGISILDCLAYSRDLSGNRMMARRLQHIATEIAAGKGLAQSFVDAGIFPPLVTRMMRVGESTGRLDTALLNVSYFYDRDVRDAIKKLQSMIEPVMTMVLGLLVGWVVLAILSPIYDVVGKIAP